MPTLFDPVAVGDLQLPNRIVMAPLTRNRAPGAVPTELTAAYYSQRASAGLLVPEATALTHQGQGSAPVPRMSSEEQAARMRMVPDAGQAGGGGYGVLEVRKRR